MNQANIEGLPDINVSSSQFISSLSGQNQIVQPDQTTCLKCAKTYDDSHFNIECPTHKMCITCRLKNPDRCTFNVCNRRYSPEESRKINEYIEKIEESYFTCDLCEVKKLKFMRKVNDQCDCKVCLMCSVGDPYECAYCCQRTSEIIISDVEEIMCSICKILLDSPELLHTHNCYLSH